MSPETKVLLNADGQSKPNALLQHCVVRTVHGKERFHNVEYMHSGHTKEHRSKCFDLWHIDEIHVLMGYFRVTVRLMLSYQ
jgi:hypothetical protein